MFTRHYLGRFAPVLLAFGASTLAAQVRADDTYITDFAKTNNIYTALNQEFPHSGTGVPGSGVGTPNAQFLFNPQTYTSPNSLGRNQTTNGVLFDITSDMSGHDFSEINAFPIGGGNNALTIPLSVANASSVHLLMNSYDDSSANFTFTGSGGATETFGNIFLHDFNNQLNNPNNYSLAYNSSSPDFFDQTVFQVRNTGGGGTGNSSDGETGFYGMDEDTFLLSSAFANQTLQSITITRTSVSGDPLLLGITVSGASSSTTPEPGSLATFAAGLTLAGMLLPRARRRRA